MSLVHSNSYKAKMSKSFWIYDSENGACPGNCDPAYAMEQNVWRCGCGCWDIVSEAPFHLFPDLAKWDGQLPWGDVYMDELEEENEKLSADQRRMRDLLEGSKRREANEAAARGAALSEIAKAKSILCDRSGKMRKATVMRPCRYFNFKGQLGVPEPGGVNKKGVAWLAGCELHRNGCCEFVHPNQPEWQQILEGARPLSRDGQRDFSVLLQGKRRF
uniref:Uncharacterized protein n=1 Tax=viral metagenome TaxID=1070528 RepID=A0A6C0BCD9_9ZZZZ